MEKVVLLRDLGSGHIFAFKSFTDVSKALGVSAQAVSSACSRGGVLRKQYMVEYGTKYYLVRIKHVGYRLCTFDEVNRSFREVGGGELEWKPSVVMSKRDITDGVVNGDDDKLLRCYDF